ncbi:NADPH2:quinone reductase [Lentzea albidocapillata subsp. violacea]|uniref:NADPH2:quinone reductase n=1 Tax=Lentzea albidocapillata subsp. violacea TaxID=128104 RepID=A0A1G9LMJ8_9PSEU|nr:NAD(P)-dependent alcohol dehydrogenase [Lentzea albidocapillata]SDL63116.1 NADPH2:quinone reductase [Lentzea albidocapillata subsp. violacea]
MRAAVHTSFGPPDVVQVVEKPLPTLRPGDVLIKVHATTVTSAECAMRRGEPLWGRVILGLRRPRAALRTLGLEVAGVVDSVGSAVTGFQAGDEVFGFTGFAAGAHADYVRLPATGSLVMKPPSLTFAEAAAAVDGATTALFFLRDKAKVRPGDRVLVNGASGSIGTYAVQLAKHLGATVTAVCGPSNVELVKSLGADEVIDYTAHDFTADPDSYDVVFDTVTKSSYRASRRALRAGGKYLPTTGLPNTFWALWTALRGGKRVVVGMSVNKRATLPVISSLLDEGKLRVVVDRTYPLARIADAHRYVDAGHKRGNVVVTVAE